MIMNRPIGAHTSILINRIFSPLTPCDNGHGAACQLVCSLSSANCFGGAMQDWNRRDDRVDADLNTLLLSPT